MADPNFMVIGTQKGGTSWLAKMLNQHPEVFVPKGKELHFFNIRDNFSRGLNWYQGCFAGAEDCKAIGDFTPNYLWSCPNQQEIDERGVIPNIAELVHRQYPDLKLIVSLRNPVDRAISAYYHFIRTRGFSPLKRIHEVGHTNGIISMGFYKQDIEKWLKYYPLSNFRFVIYEDDIRKNKVDTLRGIFRFLEVDEDFEPENLNTKYNARMGDLYMHLNYYSPLFAKAFFKVFGFLRSSNFPKIEVTASEVSRLEEIYRKENEGLSELIGRSLPWREMKENQDS